MAKKKIRIGILFGGRSGEHEVSLLSAASILKAIDRKKYEIVPLGITKQGQWVRDDEAQHLLTGKPAPSALEAPAEDDPEIAIAAAVIRSGEPLSIPAPKPHPTQTFTTIDLIASADTALAPSPQDTNALGVDLIFPVLHGTYGEDGTLLDGSFHTYLLARVLETAGLSLRDVTRVELAPAASLHALEAGRVDAWVAMAPLLDGSLSAGLERVQRDRRPGPTRRDARRARAGPSPCWLSLANSKSQVMSSGR